MRCSEAEMLALWKRRMGLPEQDCGCVVTQTDGREMDEWLKERLRSWYARMLAEAPVEMLPVRDVSSEVERLAECDDGRVRWLLPEYCGRVLSVLVEGWERRVSNPVAAGSEAEELTRWPGLEPTADNPLLVQRGRLMEAAPWGAPVEVLAVAPPEDGSYELNEALLELLPSE